MRPTIKINQKDLNELNRKLQFLKSVDSSILPTELGRTALEISREAKNIAPVDTGGLRQSITPVISGKTVSVTVKKNYAPYVEFGTGSKVDLTDMLALGIPSSYAAQFKGKGIKKINLPARPFLFNSARKGLQMLLLRLTKRIQKFR